MNLLLLAHNALSSNSGNHVCHLANGLAELGVEVAVAVPDTEDAAVPAGFTFRVVTYSQARGLRFADGAGVELIHAWTPRQHVARATRQLAQEHACPYIIHLEDNEHALTAAFLQISINDLLEQSATNPQFQVPGYLAHPADMRALIEQAAGVTALIDRLLEFRASGQPGIEFWPAAEEELFRPQPGSAALRRSLKIPDGAKVLVYHGNVHPANITEVRTLYLALEALIRSGTDLVLVRLGKDYSGLMPAEGLASLAPRVVTVPFQPREALPRYLALADVLVQPGRPDAFNDYRFPSKLPEFLAMGRPVVLPASNVGLQAQHMEDAMVLKHGSALEIAGAIRQILHDPRLASKLARNARQFYETRFSWKRASEKVLGFYASIGGARLDSLDSDAALGRVAKHYAGHRVAEPLGYATVRDYSDSVDHLRSLATLNRDLKDAQRPWVLKAILGTVPIGGRLLEIGAGDPWVADLLSRLGYEVFVVDPYDGRDRGPDQYEQIKRQYPRVTFLRGLFPDALSSVENPVFDCIYSISVLEHLPLDAVKPVFAGIAKHSRHPTSPTIHAIDHVLLGDGAEAHHTRLREMMRCLGFADGALEAMFARLDRDPDAYFLSAESHNLWRGALPYDDFPMRRCVSVQVHCPAGGVSHRS
jgi:glycosyltransferase involved in cell wall biosynthesis